MSMIALVMSMVVQSTDPYISPPTLPGAPSCTCSGNEEPDVSFSGYVIDAKVILGADRRSIEDRMATIFDVKYSDNSKASGRTAVWHNVSEEFCGISFDYGKKYEISARWGENGELETDQCLMGE